MRAADPDASGTGGGRGAAGARPGGPRAGPLLLTALALLAGVPAVSLGGDSLAVDVVGQLLAAALCVPVAVLGRRAGVVSGGRWGTGWRLLSWTSVLWAAANLVTVLSVALPGRGLDTLIYPLQGAAMLTVVAALLAMPRPGWGPGQGLRTWLDMAVLLGSLTLLLSTTLPDGALTGASGVDRVLAVAYPAASLLMLGLAYELTRRHVYPARPELGWLAGGFAAWLGAAAAYTLTPVALVAPAYVSWAVGLGTAVLAVAAWSVVHRDDVDELGTPVTRVVLAAPEISAVVTAAAVIVTGLAHWSQQLLAALVVVAGVARHGVVSGDARRFHWRLQREVAQRTVELQGLTERYVSILDTVGDGIVSVDAEGRITFANVAARRMVGAGAEELVGHDACEALCVVHDETCVFAEAHLGGALGGSETELRRRQGGVVPVELHARPHEAVPGPDGSARGRGAVIAFRDVSERLAVEQVKRQFVSAVSHELRTPLTSVRGVLEMLVDGDAGELTPVGGSLVANASRGVERLSRLVDDIIDAEKLATGQFQVRRERLRLAQVLHETAAALQPLASGVDVGIEVEVEGSPEVWGDADRVEQALVNLVGNAVKYSPPGGVVRIAAREHEREVLVTVDDDGPGIPADQLDHVFERFHQVVGEESGGRGGTGLGLTITRSIVTLHGGRIWVDSVLGEGARFSFTLPRAVPGTARGAEPSGR